MDAIAGGAILELESLKPEESVSAAMVAETGVFLRKRGGKDATGNVPVEKRR